MPKKKKEKKESVSDGHRCLIENQKGLFKNAIIHKNTIMLHFIRLNVKTFKIPKCITYTDLESHFIAACVAENDGAYKPTRTSFLWNSWVKCQWMWEKDCIYCRFIPSDTPQIPSSHLCHFLFTSDLMTEPLINRDNNVFVLASPPAQRQIAFFQVSEGETVQTTKLSSREWGQFLLFYFFKFS